MECGYIAKSFGVRKTFRHGAFAGRKGDAFQFGQVLPWRFRQPNAGYHYLGCAKTFALMGRAFADATLQLMRGSRAGN